MVNRIDNNEFNNLVIDLYALLPQTVIDQDQANKQEDKFGEWDLTGAAWDATGAKWDQKGKARGPILQRFFWAIEQNEAEFLEEMAGKVSPLVVEEKLGGADGVITTYTGVLDYTPVDPHSIQITAPTTTAGYPLILEDDGEGNFTKDGTGSVNYTTGAYSVTFVKPPEGDFLPYVDYSFNVEESKQVNPGLPGLVDVDKCPAKFLPYFATKLGGILDDTLPVEAQRFYIKGLIPTWKTKGTDRSYQILFRSRLMKINIHPLYKTSIFEAHGRYSRTRSDEHPYAAARIDIELSLGDIDGFSEASMSQIMDLLHMAKPAHVLLRNVTIIIGPVVDKMAAVDENDCCEITWRFEHKNAPDPCSSDTVADRASMAEDLFYGEGIYRIAVEDATCYRVTVQDVVGSFTTGETLSSGVARLLDYRYHDDGTLSLFCDASLSGAVAGDTSGTTATVLSSVDVNTPAFGVPAGEKLVRTTQLQDDEYILPCTDDLHIIVCPGECNEEHFIV